MKTSHSAATLLATTFCVIAAGALVMQPGASAQAPQRPNGPVAVRNERPRGGQEVLVLRHQQLKKGAHDEYYSPPIFTPALPERYRLSR